MWHVRLTRNTWHVTRAKLHVTHDRWEEVKLISIFQLPSSYGLGVKVFWIYFHISWLSQWMNDKGVCRTALATPGRVIIESILMELKYHWYFIKYHVKLVQRTKSKEEFRIYSVCYNFQLVDICTFFSSSLSQIIIYKIIRLSKHSFLQLCCPATPYLSKVDGVGPVDNRPSTD